ncbi:MAG: hypothetical protein KF799_09875 [Bdellovibrionales bacterium]|nr:hypothetical protein [Bdellovibrionales bacterium]
MLRAGSLVLISMLSWQTWAGNFDFLPGTEGPEKEFQSLMNAGNYRQALVAWTPAHSGSAFGTSQSGVATYAYLLYQNGLPYNALDLLTKATKPAALKPQLLKIWSAELKSSVWIQRGWISSGNWRSIVNNDAVVLKIANKKDVQAAFARASRLSADQTNAKARVWWQIATLAPQIGDVDSSLKALKLLKESGQTAIGQDMILSAYGRVTYQKGDTTAAAEYFNQIPKNSNLWVESVEERAWAHLRADDFDKALGEVTTLMSPALVALVGPESYFLSNLMSLKTCDYPRLFKTSETFKKRHRDRLIDMQELATNGSNKNLSALLERFDKNGVSIESSGPIVSSLPRAGLRDSKFVRLMESRRQLLAEVEKLNELKSATAALGGAGELERFSMASRRLADRNRQQAVSRLRVLAQGEVKEYRMVLNKMHILEGEVIERLHLDENLKGERSKLAKVEDQGDVLVFPYKSDEVWFDELDNYKARVKDCPTLKGASL